MLVVNLVIKVQLEHKLNIKYCLFLVNISSGFA